MFKSKNRVRMHDTDMAGILYFPRQFRFIHDAWEDFMDAEGMSFQDMFTTSDFAFVVVHAESDYLKSLQVGDHLEVHLYLIKIGTTSFTVGYDIHRISEPKDLVGTGNTVHVTVDRITRKKVPVPESLKEKLLRYQK